MKLVSLAKKSYSISWKNIKRKRFTIVGGTAIVVFVLLWFFIAPPIEYSGNHVIAIQKGMTLAKVGTQLAGQSIIRSPLIFDTLVLTLAGNTGAKAGVYYFKQPASVFTVAWRVAHGDFGIEPSHVTIFEGTTIAEMADAFAAGIPGFDKQAFLSEAKGKEGYLFPDTYFFPPGATPEDVIKKMSLTFDQKVSTIKPLIATSGHSLGEIITMASILEKEAHTFEDKRLISGILWKRISIGMPLQVDATFLYINGKNTYELTTADLAYDSPYNTYKYKGLPPGPISNPGLDSIRAAADPEDSDYLFYLSDRQGNFHFAQDFATHKENKYLYIN